VLLVGGSGRGKTYSFRNMNKETTCFINVENKPLPFKGGFKHTVVPDNHVKVLDAIKKASADDSIDCIVVDSFSAYMDMLLKESRSTKRGFDIWNYYNEEIGRFNEYVKKAKKEVFVTAHYEIIGDELSGQRERRVKSKGKEWEGMIEKDYTIVLFAESIPQEEGRPEHIFSLVNDGTSSAKCPPEMFGEDVLSVPNDTAHVLEKIKEFVA